MLFYEYKMQNLAYCRTILLSEFFVLSNEFRYDITIESRSEYLYSIISGKSKISIWTHLNLYCIIL